MVLLHIFKVYYLHFVLFLCFCLLFLNFTWRNWVCWREVVQYNLALTLFLVLGVLYWLCVFLSQIILKVDSLNFIGVHFGLRNTKRVWLGLENVFLVHFRTFVIYNGAFCGFLITGFLKIQNLQTLNSGKLWLVVINWVLASLYFKNLFVILLLLGRWFRVFLLHIKICFLIP